MSYWWRRRMSSVRRLCRGRCSLLKGRRGLVVGGRWVRSGGAMLYSVGLVWLAWERNLVRNVNNDFIIGFMQLLWMLFIHLLKLKTLSISSMMLFWPKPLPKKPTANISAATLQKLNSQLLTQLDNLTSLIQPLQAITSFCILASSFSYSTSTPVLIDLNLLRLQHTTWQLRWCHAYVIWLNLSLNVLNLSNRTYRCSGLILVGHQSAISAWGINENLSTNAQLLF